MLDALSRNDLIRLLELQSSCINSSSSTESLGTIVNKLQDVLPFDKLIVSFNVTGPSKRRRSEYCDFGFSDRWLRFYRNADLGLVDPVLHHAVGNSHGFSWSEAIERSPRDCRHFTHRAHDFGLDFGISCGCEVGAATGQSTLVNMAYPHQRYEPIHKQVLTFITPHLHQAFTQHAGGPDPEDDSPKLTDAEKEVLRWCRDGKTAWEIGVILSRSERTIKFHLSNIYRKLDVTNRVHAVAKALQLGYIEE